MGWSLKIVEDAAFALEVETWKLESQEMDSGAIPPDISAIRSGVVRLVHVLRSAAGAAAGPQGHPDRLQGPRADLGAAGLAAPGSGTGRPSLSSRGPVCSPSPSAQGRARGARGGAWLDLRVPHPKRAHSSWTQPFSVPVLFGAGHELLPVYRMLCDTAVLRVASRDRGLLAPERADSEGPSRPVPVCRGLPSSKSAALRLVLLPHPLNFKETYVSVSINRLIEV